MALAMAKDGESKLALKLGLEDPFGSKIMR
jgi:hypothetical protein